MWSIIKWTMGFIALMTVVQIPFVMADENDPPLFNRYPGSEVMGNAPSTREFDEFTLVTGKVKGEMQYERSVNLEGKVFEAQYFFPENRSEMEIFRNYEDALKKAGFQTLFSCKNEQCGEGRIQGWGQGAGFDPSYENRYLAAKLSRPQGDVYVAIALTQQRGTTFGTQRIAVIQVKPMQGGMVVVDAKALQEEIARTGHVAVYGILFDTGKADVKPESDAALKEVQKLMAADPKLKLHVVGHTDNVGMLESNMDLSKRRAVAVVDVLVKKYGVVAARLRADGVGPLVPVVSNGTDEGRAKNRRVELVEQ